MKITNEHFAHMRSAILPFDTAEVRAKYIDANLSDKRYRWDLARAAGLISFMCATLYAYADDDHIDTALRRIVAPLALDACAEK